MDANNTSDKLYGVVDGVYFCNNGRLDEINDSIYNRNIPSQILQPLFSMRPSSTKYATLPIVDPRRQDNTVPINVQPQYNVETAFNPGNRVSPWAGFANNINTESILRSQFFALQNCDQAIYVPSSQSDLYELEIPRTENIQPYSDLFKKQQYKSPAYIGENIKKTLFYNFTREETLDLKLPKC